MVLNNDRSYLKNLCACQKVSNMDLHVCSYSCVVPPCRCNHSQKLSKRTKSAKKDGSPSKKAQLLWNVLSALRSAEETDAIFLNGKHWVYIPRLQLSKRLNCKDEDIQNSLDVLCKDGYIESLHFSLEEDETSFFRTNRRKYKKFFWAYPAINHQAVNFWI